MNPEYIPPQRSPDFFDIHDRLWHRIEMLKASRAGNMTDREIQQATTAMESALDCINRLKSDLNAANADLAQRTAERDEARREYCEARYREERVDLRSTPTLPVDIADNRGWDCFDAKEGQR